MNRAQHAALLLLAALSAGCGDCRSVDKPGTCGDAEGNVTQNTSDIEALEVLNSYCAGCHAGGALEGGFGHVDDPAEMVRTGHIVPGDPAGSTLYMRLSSGSMPPLDPKPSAAEVEAVRLWIEAGAEGAEAEPARDFISPEAMHGWMRDDLEDIEELERGFIRYVSLVHLYNGGVPQGELEAYRTGLSKLLNSLSWMPAIANPVAVEGSQELVYRVDLRDYRWQSQTDDPVDAWELLLRDYPYAFVYDDSAFQTLRAQTQSRLPVLHGDWLVNASSVPPLYHEVLNLPDTLPAFLDLFGVDRLRNIENLLVDRAGFLSSGVSENNRIIERHDAAYGACWTSYDFAGEVDTQNISRHPLDFDEDGGETICNLPNGLQVYLLSNAAGHRLDVGPDTIVQDPLSPFGTNEVVNGLSCMRCHHAGIIPKEDVIRETSLQYFPSNSETYALILALYTENGYEHGQMGDIQARDAARFLEAVDQTGVPRAYATEHVFALSEAFNEEMTLGRVAAEVGVTEAELEEQLPHLPDRLYDDLFPLNNPQNTIQRRTFLGLAQELVCFMHGNYDAQTEACLPEPQACGVSGVACLDGQACVTEGVEAGACYVCDDDLDYDGDGVPCEADADDEDPAVSGGH